MVSDHLETWNYRIVHDEGGYHLAEVYYDEDGTPWGYAERLPGYDEKDEIVRDWWMMREAFCNKVIEWEDDPER